MTEWLIAHDSFSLFVHVHRTQVKDMSMRLAAVDARVSPSAFARAENRKTISAANYLALCLWMKANPYWFLIDPKTGARLVDPPDAPVKPEGVGA